MEPQNFSVVLVEPKGDANIGAVSRTMKNFGFSDLRLVRPRVSHLSRDARNMAVTAVDLLEKAQLYDDLASALADCNLAVGTTRRFGRYREELIEPKGITDLLTPMDSSTKVAFVFGREETGLTTEELDLCQRLLTIPTHEALPSMNLAQSVAVCLYETAMALETVSRPSNMESIVFEKGERLEAMYAQMEQTFLAIGFLDQHNPAHIMRAFRRMLNRQGLNEREVQILRGMLSQIDWVEGGRQKKADS